MRTLSLFAALIGIIVFPQKLEAQRKNILFIFADDWGRYFFNTGLGAILQGAVWDSSIPVFPLMLRDAGYHIGKSHKVWSPGSPADAPFDGQKHAYQKSGNACCNFSEQTEIRIKKEG
ncbi:MAG: hypothetical protein PF904_02865 [Kiritimatiellae bacterium]|jgi:arylsulfatase A-like enzyme|nr:hypothetical protein [Kiritimatiellia bacterium]